MVPDRDDADDDRAWRAIIENYGERAELDEDPAGPVEPTPPAVAGAPFGGRFGDPRLLGADDRSDGFDDGPAAPQHEPDEEEGYEPPPPPPLPTVAPDRGLAWAGVFGSPTVLLVMMVLQISIPWWLGWTLIIGFVGGFVYLVAKMPREPRDPWDDGAQI